MMFKSLILSDLRIRLSAKPRPRISPPYAQGLNEVKTLCKGGLTTKTNTKKSSSMRSYLIEIFIDPSDQYPANIYEVDVYDNLILSVREIEINESYILPPMVGESIDEVYGAEIEELTI